jgi:peptide/nickel transport system ATP-binding protein
MSEAPVLLETRGLKTFFPIRRGALRRVAGYVRAVDDVHLSLRQGETLSLVGESGCGKTTLARSLLRIVEPTGGNILYHRDGATVDLTGLSKRQLKPIRRNFQMIFQDPHSSLNPRMTVGDIVADPLVVYGGYSPRKLRQKTAELLELVGLSAEAMYRYPHEFSGGQRQRIGIARALALSPACVVCDEAVSALDVSVQAQIINLLKKLQEDLGLTYLFVSHDLSVVEYVSDRIAVMYLGKFVELAPAEALYRTPRHPYTEALLSAIPKPDPDAPDTEIVLEGDVPSPANPPSGCYFHPRCPYSDGQRCVREAPPLREIAPGHLAACHYAETLTLRGVLGQVRGQELPRYGEQA